MPKYHVELTLTLTKSILVDAENEDEALGLADDYTVVGRRFHVTPDVELNHDSLHENGDGRWELDNLDVGDTTLMDH